MSRILSTPHPKACPEQHVLNIRTNRCCFCFAKFDGEKWGHAVSPEKALAEDLAVLTREWSDRLRELPELYVPFISVHQMLRDPRGSRRW